MSSRRAAHTPNTNIKSVMSKDVGQAQRCVASTKSTTVPKPVSRSTTLRTPSKLTAATKTQNAPSHRANMVHPREREGTVPTSREKCRPSRSNTAEEMIKSTGTESSGVFSETETTVTPSARGSNRTGSCKQHGEQPRGKLYSPRIPLPQPQRVSKPGMKEAPKSATLAEQFLRAEFKNETAALKGKHRDDLQQQRNELEEKHRRETALLLAERESFFQNQMEVKEQQLRVELLEVLDKQRLEFLRDKEEREIQMDLRLKEVELEWKRRLDDLQRQLASIVSEKDNLEKKIQEEVETRVQATQQRLVDLRKETCSLQAVLELRTEEARSLRKDLEKLTTAASECAALRERNQTLLNTVEGLRAQLEQKTNEERKLQSDLSALSNQFREESQRCRRLSMEKEQLQWKLSLHVDKSTSFGGNSGSKSLSYSDMAPTTPKVARRPLPLLKLSPVLNDDETKNNNSNNYSNAMEEGNPAATSTPRDSSRLQAALPESPTSPTVRDFMEKSASVAYVLELGENSLDPLVPALPFQRRRGLFRFSSLRWTRSTTR